MIDGKYVTIINLSLEYSRVINNNPEFLSMIKYLISNGNIKKDLDNSIAKLVDNLTDYRQIDFDYLKKDIAEKLFMFYGSIDEFNWDSILDKMRDYYYFSLLNSIWVFLLYSKEESEKVKFLFDKAKNLKRDKSRFACISELIDSMNINLPSIETIVSHKNNCLYSFNTSSEIGIKLLMMEKIKNRVIELIINNDYSYKNLYYSLLDQMYILYIQLCGDDTLISYAYDLGRSSNKSDELIEVLEEIYYLLLNNKQVDIPDHNLKLF